MQKRKGEVRGEDSGKNKEIDCRLRKKADGRQRFRGKEWKFGVLVVCRTSALCLEGPSICLDAPAGLPLHLRGGRTVTPTEKLLCNHMEKIFGGET